MRADVRLSAIAIGLVLIALLIPYLAVRLIVLTAIAAGLIIAVVAR